MTQLEVESYDMYLGIMSFHVTFVLTDASFKNNILIQSSSRNVQLRLNNFVIYFSIIT